MSLFRFLARKPFALAVLFCMVTAFLFTGCKTDDDADPVVELDADLIGTWASIYDDSYNITSAKLAYDDGYGGGFVGTIRYASQFTGDAGVIIIEYDADRKPTYYDSSENYGDPAHIVELKGNFIGIYYKDLKPQNSMLMGYAYINGGAEEKTLDKAKKAFTMGNEGKYMEWYGTYSK